MSPPRQVDGKKPEWLARAVGMQTEKFSHEAVELRRARTRHAARWCGLARGTRE